MLSCEHGYHHSHSDSLIAARAALRQAIRGRDDFLIEYVCNYQGHARLLAEALGAISAAAAEAAEASAQAQRLWASIMDLVLDFSGGNNQLFRQRTWGEYAAAALIPNPTDRSSYLSSELSGQPCSWINLILFSSQVERWLSAVPHSRMTIDQLVVAIHLLPVADQVDQGLKWVECAVTSSGSKCASTFTLPEWLGERRMDLNQPDQQARWQRVVDYLAVAGDKRVSHLSD